MQYAGIFVLLRPEGFQEGIDGLEVIEGVEVHHREPETGRAIVVAEMEAGASHDAVLGLIRAVPGVVIAEPTYCYEAEAGEERS